jgi:hypothetical protein
MTTRLLSLLFAATFVAVPAPAAETPADVVPVERASFHVPAFRNDAVAMLSIFVPPGRSAPYHRHARDLVYVALREADFLVQNLGDLEPASIHWPRGLVGFGAYSEQSLTHRVTNSGKEAIRAVAFELLEAAPRGRPVSQRPPPYERIIDNRRLRGWRLVLAPGEAAPAFEQGAPAVRVVVDGGLLVETAADDGAQEMALRTGDFQWRDPGAGRALRNAAETTIVLVELELK